MSSNSIEILIIGSNSKKMAWEQAISNCPQATLVKAPNAHSLINVPLVILVEEKDQNLIVDFLERGINVLADIALGNNRGDVREIVENSINLISLLKVFQPFDWSNENERGNFEYSNVSSIQEKIMMINLYQSLVGPTSNIDELKNKSFVEASKEDALNEIISNILKGESDNSELKQILSSYSLFFKEGA